MSFMQLTTKKILALFSPELRTALAGLCPACGGLYLVGGSVRDVLLQKRPRDLDLAVPRGAQAFARQLACRLNASFVVLDEQEDVARVVSEGQQFDIAAFRAHAQTIAKDLGLRDFTINALALDVTPLLRTGGEEASAAIIDPCGGLDDIKKRVIRHTHPGAFQADPLRLLRAQRFAATLDFTLAQETQEALARDYRLIASAAGERINAELAAIMQSPRAYAACMALRACGMLFVLFPELAAGEGQSQPRSHHLDVLDHNLETLHQAELLVASVDNDLLGARETARAWFKEAANILALKWAALLHDVGKPATRALRADGRITFYQHEHESLRQIRAVARRLCWSTRQSNQVCQLVALHMRPFHLLNEARKHSLSLKAQIRLVQAAGDELWGLLALARADALAGQGEERPPHLDDELALLIRKLAQVFYERLVPTRNAPPLLTGDDLIARLGLPPGPLFKIILEAVQMARLEGRITSFEEALTLARRYAQTHACSRAE